MATGYTRIGKNLVIPYEKPDPVKPAKKTKKVEAPKIEPVCPMPDPEPVAQKSFLESAVESAVEAVKPKRRGRPKKNDEATQ